MTSSGYTVASLEELRCDEGFAPIRLALGVRSFGMSAWMAGEADSELVPEHDEAGVGHEELYVVIAGHAAFTVGGEEIDAPTGTIVFINEPSTVRAATALEAGTTVLAVGGKPGEAYSPVGWELTRQAVRLLDEQRYAEAKPIFQAALDDAGDSSYALYNLACVEALLAETDAAFTHLAEAIALKPAELSELARDDSDLESLRSDPRFEQLLG